MLLEVIKGQSVRVRGSFFDDADDPTDPTDVEVRVKPEGGATTTYTFSLAEVTQEAVGVYSKVIVPDESGKLEVGFTGTGVQPVVEEDYLLVNPSAFD